MKKRGEEERKGWKGDKVRRRHEKQVRGMESKEEKRIIIERKKRKQEKKKKKESREPMRKNRNEETRKHKLLPRSTDIYEFIKSIIICFSGTQIVYMECLHKIRPLDKWKTTI